jgi:hypothetical protein
VLPPGEAMRGEMSTWKPIASAPRGEYGGQYGGPDILVFVPLRNAANSGNVPGGRVSVAHWNGERFVLDRKRTGTAPTFWRPLDYP